MYGLNCQHANQLTGQLEGTILKAFLRAANLKRWLARRAIGSYAIRLCKTLFDKIYGDRSSDSHHQELALADEDHAKRGDQPTPEELKAFVTSPRVVLHARHRSKGIIYARARTHLGNSLVLFYPHGDVHSTPIPGSIQEVYSVGGTTFFAIRRYHKSSLSNPGAFAQWPEFPAGIWSTKGEEDILEEVEVPWIHSHFAQLAISDGNVVVLDLTRI